MIDKLFVFTYESQGLIAVETETEYIPATTEEFAHAVFRRRILSYKTKFIRFIKITVYEKVKEL